MSEQRCILNERKKGGCASCSANCGHRISLEGLSGTGGRVGASGLPKDYRHLTLKTSPVREEQTKVYGMLDAYVATFDRQFDEEAPPIKSVYMWATSPGNGKTTSAASLANEFLIAHYLGSLKRGKQPLERPVFFLDLAEWQELYTGFTRQGIPQEIAEANSRPYYRQMELAKKTPFVVLDDIGVRGIATDAFRGDLHTIINYRNANGLATVYTSNLPLEDMATIFDARLYDRMRDQCVVLHFDGASKRGKR